MQVRLLKNQKTATGLAAQFPYNPRHVETIKECLGFQWDKANGVWHAS